MIRAFKAISVEAEVCGAVLHVTWNESDQSLSISGVETFAEAAGIIDALGRATPLLGFKAQDLIPKTDKADPTRVAHPPHPLSAEVARGTSDRAATTDTTKFTTGGPTDVGSAHSSPGARTDVTVHVPETLAHKAAETQAAAPATTTAPASDGLDEQPMGKTSPPPEAAAPAVEGSADFATMENMTQVVAELQKQGCKNVEEISVRVNDLHDSGECPMLLRIPNLANRIISTCTVLQIPGAPGAPAA